MRSAADLSRIQRWFWELITAPEGVEQGLARLEACGGASLGEIAEVVRGDDRLGPTERLGIYADMYFYRLRDSLAEDFPKLAAVVGGARFHNLVTDYLLAHPSRSWSLRYLGEALPGYLDRHPIGEEFPYVHDLARLEWARIETFDEEDAPPLERSAVTSLAPEAMEALTIGLVPASRLLALDWSVAAAWRQLEDQEGGAEPGTSHSAAVDGTTCAVSRPPVPVEAPARKRTFLRVWRQEFAVYHRTIGEDEHACLEELRSGATLPRLCDVMLASSRGAAADAVEARPEAERRMAGLLDLWLREGLIRRKDEFSDRDRMGTS